MWECVGCPEVLRDLLDRRGSVFIVVTKIGVDLPLILSLNSPLLYSFLHMMKGTGTFYCHLFNEK